MADGSPKKLTTLERIQRLEQVEVDRLEHRARIKQARDEKVAAATDAAQKPGSALERFEKRADRPMVVLGGIWLVVFVFALLDNGNHVREEVLVGILFALWAVFVVEYLIRLVLAPDRRSYVSTRKIEPAVVAVPPLQCLRLMGLEKADLVVGEFVLRTKAILQHRGLFRVLLTVLGLVFLGAWLAMLAEGGASGATSIHSYWDGLWWAIVTVTTVGYGDRFPVTTVGRVVAIVLMLIGIGLIGVLTATVASFFLREHADENKAQLQKAHQDLGDQLTDIDSRLDRLERLVSRALAIDDDRSPQ